MQKNHYIRLESGRSPEATPVRYMDCPEYLSRSVFAFLLDDESPKFYFHVDFPH